MFSHLRLENKRDLPAAHLPPFLSPMCPFSSLFCSIFRQSHWWLSQIHYLNFWQANRLIIHSLLWLWMSKGLGLGGAQQLRVKGPRFLFIVWSKSGSKQVVVCFKAIMPGERFLVGNMRKQVLYSATFVLNCAWNQTNPLMNISLVRVLSFANVFMFTIMGCYWFSDLHFTYTCNLIAHRSLSS